MECDIGVGVRVSRVGESRRRWRLRLPAKIPTDTLDIEALYTRRRGSVEATVRLQGLLPTPCGPSVLPTSLPPPAG